MFHIITKMPCTLYFFGFSQTRIPAAEIYTILSQQIQKQVGSACSSGHSPGHCGGSRVCELINRNEYPVRDMLDLLLKDKTTGQNIIFATDSYAALGGEYSETGWMPKLVVQSA